MSKFNERKRSDWIARNWIIHTWIIKRRFNKTLEKYSRWYGTIVFAFHRPPNRQSSKVGIRLIYMYKAIHFHQRICMNGRLRDECFFLFHSINGGYNTFEQWSNYDFTKEDTHRNKHDNAWERVESQKIFNVLNQSPWLPFTNASTF